MKKNIVNRMKEIDKIFDLQACGILIDFHLSDSENKEYKKWRKEKFKEKYGYDFLANLSN